MPPEQDGDANGSQFTSQTGTVEDILKSQTVGLVNLDDFRKRRADALERKEREAQTKPISGSATPLTSADGSERDGDPSFKPLKKKRKMVSKGKLSFRMDAEDEDSESPSVTANKPRGHAAIKPLQDTAGDEDDTSESSLFRIRPNSKVGHTPKVMTKAAQAKEAETRERLRKEFIQRRERVRTTEIAIPFVFYDGTNIPGGICKVKKGDQIWLYLDKARKVGAELGVRGADKSKKDWARVGVDDLMFVRGEMIIPHHYDFYYFILNKTKGYKGLLFNYSAEPSEQPHSQQNVGDEPPGAYLHSSSDYEGTSTPALEGADEDPSSTKVVDRRWYERNKHIYPASAWEEFDPNKVYGSGARRDNQGNTMFFS